MDGTRMQALVNKGYRIAASHVGLPYQWYRPSTATPAIVEANLLGVLPASFSADNYAYKKPNLYGRPTWSVLVDGAITRVGDYLVGPAGTFFIIAQQALLPIVAVECNAVVSLFRPHSSNEVGEIEEYGGDDASAEDPLANGCPCSLLTKSRGEKSDAALPGDVKAPWFELLLPAIPGTDIKYNDIIDSADFQRFKVSSAEKTDLGWRILAMLATP